MPAKKDKSTKPNIAARYEARSIANDIQELMQDPRRFAWTSFRFGIYRGIGFTIGATLVVIAVSVLVTIFGAWPYIGDFLNHIDTALKSTK